MEQKKCLNCLCLVSVSERSCPFCRTPFASGKKAQSIPLSLKKFNPPNIASDEQKKLARISRNVRVVSAEEVIREERSELEISAQELLRKRIERYKEIFSDIDPFAYSKQDFSSLEIEEIKQEEKKEETIDIRGVDVEAEKLKELTAFAKSISTVSKEISPKELNEEIPPQEKNFETKSTIRTSTEKIIEKSNGQESFNMNIVSLIEVLESVSLEDVGKNENKPQENSDQILDLSSLANLVVEEIKTEKSASEKAIDFSSLANLTDEEIKSEKSAAKQISEVSKNPETLPIPTFPELISEKENLHPSNAVVRSPEYNRLLANDGISNQAGLNQNPKIEKVNPPKPISGARGTNNAKAMEYYNNARNLCLKGSYEQAMNELENSVRIDPAYEQAHILLSRTYLKLKNG